MSKQFDKSDPKHKDYWATPDWAVKGLARLFWQYKILDTYEIDLDVCANEHNHKAKEYISEVQDTLKTPWGENKLCWMNPPYSNVQPFLEKAVAERANGNTTIALMKNDCSTKWFRYALENASAVLFILNGRIGFHSAITGKPVGGNNFSSVVFVFTPVQSHLRTIFKPITAIKKYGELE